MARRWFPDESSRLGYSILGQFLAHARGKTVFVYSDAGASVPADIRDANGISIASLQVDAYSRFPLWQGPPDGTDTLYLVVDGGPVTTVYARTDDRLDDLNTRLVAVEALSEQPLDADLTALAALDSTQAGAIASDGAGWVRKTYAQLKTALGLVKADVGLANVDNTSDANKPVSTAQAAAIAARAPVSATWQANTAYKAGQVVSYLGTLYTAIADFTAGASFNAANWTLASSGAFVTEPTVDLNNGFPGVPGVNPGDDITAALQAAYDYIAANFPAGGRILLHVPGTYLLNGAPQTGTYTNGSSNYTWRGQILLPALTMANTKTISLEGVAASSGDSNTGGPTGVIIQSNATSGYIMDARPAFTRFAASSGQLCCWTGAVPRFRNITILAPDNPTCGGLNLFATQRAQFERTYVQTPTFNGTVDAGTLAGLVWPQVNNNGDLLFDSSFVRGFPVGMVLSEHVRARNSLISGCVVAFQSSGTGHANVLDIDIEECPTVFDGTAYAGIVGTPNTFAGTMVDAKVDFENTGAVATLQPQVGAFVKDTRTGPIKGQVHLWLEGNKTLPVIGGSELDVVPLTRAPSIGPIFRAGWMSTHPYDNFGRLAAHSGAGAPGQCSATMHPWRTESGTFAVSADGKLTASATGYAFVPTKFGGVSRIVSATFQLAAAGEVRVVAQSPVTASGGASNAGTTGIAVRCVQGSSLALRANNNSLVGLDSITLLANTTYTVDLEVIYGWQSASGVLQAAYPVLARVYLNGTFVGQQAIPPAHAAFGSAAPVTFPIYEDGLAILDTASFFTLFRVRDSNGDPRRQHVVTKTGARTAHHFETTVCTSGTFTVTLPAPVQDAPNVIINTGAGTITVAPPSGTLTNLSGATGNLTLTQGQRAEIISPDGTNFQQVA